MVNAGKRLFLLGRRLLKVSFFSSSSASDWYFRLEASSFRNPLGTGSPRSRCQVSTQKSLKAFRAKALRRDQVRSLNRGLLSRSTSPLDGGMKYGNRGTKAFGKS